MMNLSNMDSSFCCDGFFVMTMTKEEFMFNQREMSENKKMTRNTMVTRKHKQFSKTQTIMSISCNLIMERSVPPLDDDFDSLADYWYYDIVVNVIPADTRN